MVAVAYRRPRANGVTDHLSMVGLTFDLFKSGSLKGRLIVGERRDLITLLSWLATLAAINFKQGWRGVSVMTDSGSEADKPSADINRSLVVDRHGAFYFVAGG